jgi:ribosomal protein S27E
MPELVPPKKITPRPLQDIIAGIGVIVSLCDKIDSLAEGVRRLPSPEVDEIADTLLVHTKAIRNTLSDHIAASVEAKMRCPKCDSNRILIGTSKEPSHCNACGHTWYIPQDAGKPQSTILGGVKTESLQDRIYHALNK